VQINVQLSGFNDQLSAFIDQCSTSIARVSVSGGLRQILADRNH